MPFSESHLGILLGFWVSSIVNCIHKHIHMKALRPCSLATATVFTACSVTLSEVVPITTDLHSHTPERGTKLMTLL